MKALQRSLGPYPIGIWIALAAILLSLYNAPGDAHVLLLGNVT